jgi:hypothetical protein
MEKDGDSEEDNDEEVVKQVLHPHYLSPSFSVILTTSPSFIPFNPPPHYLSSLSCNIIIHLITSVFLPSPSSLLTLPNERKEGWRGGEDD